MAKQNHINTAQAVPLASSRRNQRVILLAVTTLATAVAVVASATAANVLLRGKISITERRPPETTQTRGSMPFGYRSDNQKQSADLLDRYGAAASSPAVAAAIKDAESVAKNTDGARAASDSAEALQNGNWTPGADPMMAIMYGYVPPGMDQTTAAMLSRSLPKLPKMPGPVTPEQIARMAGEPIDPLAASLPEGLTRRDIDAANQKMLSGYMRERFGPVYVPPLHRPPQSTIFAHVAKDNQGSIREMVDASGNIVAQYTYTPFGERTKLAGTGPDADFGFQGMYYHARSGLYLTPFRAYDPRLGRWLSRDPIGEHGGTNLYAFVGNDPINRTDPLGLQGRATLLRPTSAATSAGEGTGTGFIDPAILFHPFVNMRKEAYHWPQYVGPYRDYSSCHQAAYDRFLDCVKNPNKYPEPKTMDCSPSVVPEFDPRYQPPAAKKCIDLLKEWLHDCNLMFPNEA